MSDFDPDAYLAQKRTAAAFDPDAYLREKGSTPAPADVSKSETAGRAALQGATFGGSDELGGAVQGGLQAVANVLPGGALDAIGIENRYNQPVSETYAAGRDAERQANVAAQKAHPTIYTGAETAGGLATALLPGGAAAKGAGTVMKVAKGAQKVLSNPWVGGAINSLGHAEGSGLEQAGETVAGAVTAKILDKGLRGLGSKFKGAAEWLRGKAAKAGEDKIAQATAKIDKGISSAKGELGSMVQQASRDLEVLEREAASGVSAVADKARAYLQSPEAQALKNMVLENKLTSAPDRVGSVASLKDTMSSLAGSRVADIEREIAEKSANPIASVITPRLKAHLINKGVPVALTGLGSAAGSLFGDEENSGRNAAIGGSLGFAGALFGGNPGTVIKNVANNPYLREYLAQGGAKIMQGIGAGLEKTALPAVLETTDDPDKFSRIAEWLKNHAR